MGTSQCCSKQSERPISNTDPQNIGSYRKYRSSRRHSLDSGIIEYKQCDTTETIQIRQEIQKEQNDINQMIKNYNTLTSL